MAIKIGTVDLDQSKIYIGTQEIEAVYVGANKVWPDVAATIWIAGGNGTNTLAYSTDGINWVGMSKAYITVNGNCAVKTADSFIVAGFGTYNYANSADGINWNKRFINFDWFNGIAWNGSILVAVCEGTANPNTLAYSTDGINWTGLGLGIFPKHGYGVATNVSMWVAVGDPNGNYPIVRDSIAYSYDGINWVGLGKSIFSVGYTIAWNGSMWMAGGSGTNTLAYSTNGINWVGLGKTIFSTDVRGIAWNGSMWIAVGYGTANTIAYSYDGINWTGLGKTLLSYGYCVAWNGSMWIAGGFGTNTLAYSTDGINWVGLGNSIFSTKCLSVASSPAPNLYPPR